jgi:hypothetical protein
MSGERAAECRPASTGRTLPVVDDPYPASVSSSDRSGKVIVCRIELLNGGFRSLWLVLALRLPGSKEDA